MTEQTIKSVKDETKRETTAYWHNKLVDLHNDFVFKLSESDNKHYVCERLYELIKEMRQGE